MFEHSVKVSRHYKEATKIYKKACTEGASVKTLLYDHKLRYYRTEVLYALVSETIKHSKFLDDLFAHFKVFEKEPRLDPWIAKILATELLFGKKHLAGTSKPEQTIISFEAQFQSYLQAHENELNNTVVLKPRYVRINTNLITVSDAIKAFQDEGYRLCSNSSESYSDYVEKLNYLNHEDFIQDYHLDCVFAFASGTKFHDNKLYLEKKIILQDKATALAVYLLAPRPGSHVLDMCAAPGVKTSQLAAYMENTGQIFAVERDTRRCELLQQFIENTGCEFVQVHNKDVLEFRKGSLDTIEYILCDPSCSGSGMDCTLHLYQKDEARLEKLTAFQEKILRHAMNAFPNAKRIVYSTCSLYPEENERVVMNALKSSKAKWKVLDLRQLLKGKWNNFGSGKYGNLGTRCLYAIPESDLTTGFFVAVLDRDERYTELTEKIENDKNIIKEQKRLAFEKKQLEAKIFESTCNQDNESQVDKNEDKGEEGISVENTDVSTEIPKTRKKKRKNRDSQALNEIIDNLDSLGVEAGPETKKIKVEATAGSLEDMTKVESKAKKRKRASDLCEAEVVESQADCDTTSKVNKYKKASKKISKMGIDDSHEDPSAMFVKTKKKKEKKHKDN